MRHWYINLEDKEEEHGPARLVNLPQKKLSSGWLTCYSVAGPISSYARGSTSLVVYRTNSDG